ncbi:MAG: M23 family metallopeptidase [Lachnospiraceae bacterium]|nr:M23 family metallopeptidase [Lachnospiraceae bacterium]
MDENEKTKVEDYIPEKEKPKLKMSRYTIMLIPDSADGSKTIELTIDKIARYVVLVLAAVIIITSLIVSFAVKNYRLRNDSSLQTRIEGLLEENETLKQKNEELTELLANSDSQISNLKGDVSDLELEVAAEYIPSIIPYKGSGVMLTNIVADGSLSFTCLEGADVVSTARGKVVSLSENEDGEKEIIIDHENGYKTKYIVTGEVKVSEGDEVDKGDRIAEVIVDDEIIVYFVLLNDKEADPKEFLGD